MLEQQLAQNREKVDVVKKFVRDVDVLLEKVEAVEAENRADLMVMFVQRLAEFQQQALALERVLTQMTIEKVIEESF